MDTWYLVYNRDMAREFVETAAAWARQFDKAAATDRRSRARGRAPRAARLPYSVRVGTQDRCAQLAAIPSAGQAGPRRDRRSGVSRQSARAAEGGARVHDVGRARTRH